MAAKQVFISHVSSESDLASGLKQRVERDFLGLVAVFVSSDRPSILAGSSWLDEVRRALEQADVQLVLCSPESVGRPWVNFEGGAAWLRRIPVIPVCHSGLSPEGLPVPFSMLESVEFRPGGLQKLYDAIAAVLGVTTPAIDFDAFAAEMRALEAAQRSAASSIDRVDDPSILCASSEQYAAFDFDLDVEVLESTFGTDRVTVERALTRRRLMELLAGNEFDIVHLVVAVDPRSGDLYFSPIDVDTYQTVGDRSDKMSAAAFAELLVESQTRLVVLATCNALLLAVEVARTATMLASDTEVNGRQLEQWAESFYGLLRQGKPVYKAFDITSSQIDLPIRLVPYRDLVFSVPKP